MQNAIALAQLVALLLPIGGPLVAQQTIAVPPGTGNTFTHYPMQIRQEQVYSMRYQQVYAATAFAALQPAHPYLTRIDFRVDENTIWQAVGTTTNIEVRLSTTSKPPDALSTNFAENVGPDETLVYADAEHTYIRPGVDIFRYVFVLPKPFLYDPRKGNLLLEVRAETTGEPYWVYNYALDAHNDATDSVSRVYARSVSATEATDADTVGLNTIFHFNPVPSLHIYTSRFGTPTNWFAIEWPTQPTVFKLQRTARLGTNANWQMVTNDTGGPNASFQRYFYPVESAAPTAYFRLIWEDGVPVPPGQTSFGPPPSPPKE